MNRRPVGIFGLGMLAALAWCAPARAQLSFTLLGSWDSQARQDSAWWAMTNVVNRYNVYGDFTTGNGGNIPVYYNAGVPTAQSGYGGYGSSIEFGGTWPADRVAQHESNHWLGSGTYWNWANLFSNGVWTGPKVNALIAQFDGEGSVIRQSGVHFYGYGLNYDSEVVNDSIFMRNVALMYAMRQDMGNGNPNDPWSATTVTLTASDPIGTSAFNWFGGGWSNGNYQGWSDKYFAHKGAAYSTGDFILRTPLDTYSPAGTTPSFRFAGDSLTINNANGASGGLLFKGVGTTGVLTINNLILDGGYVRHASGAGDLFQLAGNVTLKGSSTIDAAQGDIRILAPIGGTGSLTKAGAYTLTLTASNTYTGSTAVTGGRLVLSNVGLPNTSGVAVSSGATLVAKGGIGTGGTLTSSGTVDLADGVLNTLTVGGGVSLNSSILNVELGSSNADRIAAGAAASLSGVNTINLLPTPGQGVAPGNSYTVVSAAGGLNAANFALGANKPASWGFMQFALATPTPNALLVNVTGNPTPAVAYWTGQASAVAGDSANSWGTGPGINKSNWSTNTAGTADPLQLPGSTTSVIFNAANATGVGGALNTGLDSAYAVGGLTFDVPAGPGITSTVLNTNGNTLTVGGGGVVLTSTSNSSATISGSGSVTLSGNQSWSNNSNARTLTVTSGINAASGPTTLTLNGTGTGGVTLGGALANGRGTLSAVFNQAGTTVLSAANTFTGSVSVNGGTVYANPGNAANNRAFSYVSGITVNGGATLRAGANGLFGWDGTQDRPITVNAGGTLVGLGTPTTDVGVGLVVLSGGTLATEGTTAADWGSFRFDQPSDKLSVTADSVVSATHVKFGDPGATIDVAAGKTLSFTGSVTDTTNGGISYLNKSGAGTLVMTGANTYTGATAINAGTLTVAGSLPNSPTATVAGGGTLAVTGTLTNTTTTVNNGSLVVSGTDTTTGDLWIGQGNGGNGTLNVQTGGTLNANVLLIGAGGSPTAVATGTGTLASGGTINTNQWFVVGQSGAAPSSGSFTVDGGTLNVHTNASVTGNLEMGTFDAASAILNINAGSRVNLLNNALLVFGAQGNHSGTSVVNQNGGSVTFYSDNAATVGGTGRLVMASAGNPTGDYTYNLSGGTLTVPRIVRENTANNPTTVFNFNGGTLRAAAGGLNLISGLTTANVQAGGAILDSNGLAVGLSQPLVHAASLSATPDGGLTKVGNGTLTLSGTNTYTGPTTVNAGTLGVTGSIATSAGVTINNTGTFRAAAAQKVNRLTVNAGALANVSGASGPFALTVGDNTTTTSPLTVAGRVDANNNGLIVDVAAGGEGAALTTVRQAALAAYNGGQWNGAGGLTSSQITAANRLAVGFGLPGEVSAAATNGGTQFFGAPVDASSVVVQATIAGDANLDKAVNFNDLLVLAKNYNTASGAYWSRGDFTYDGAVNFNDLLILARDYNQSMPTDPIPGASAAFEADMAAAFAAVPEPGSLALLGLGAGMLYGRHRRRRVRATHTTRHSD